MKTTLNEETKLNKKINIKLSQMSDFNEQISVDKYARGTDINF